MTTTVQLTGALALVVAVVVILVIVIIVAVVIDEEAATGIHRPPSSHSNSVNNSLWRLEKRSENHYIELD